MTDPRVLRAARNIKRGGSNQAWTPRVPQMSLHLGTLGDVDLFNGVVDFEFNDPSGLVVPGVRFLQSYSSLNPPSSGHAVWVAHTGTDLMVLGQQVIPTNIVIPS